VPSRPNLEEKKRGWDKKKHGPSPTTRVRLREGDPGDGFEWTNPLSLTGAAVRELEGDNFKVEKKRARNKGEGLEGSPGRTKREVRRQKSLEVVERATEFGAAERRKKDTFGSGTG